MRKTPRLSDFLSREDGPTAVEYAVMLAAIIVSCTMAITIVGSNTTGGINSANSAFVSGSQSSASSSSESSTSSTTPSSGNNSNQTNNGKGKAYGNDGDTTNKGN